MRDILKEFSEILLDPEEDKEVEKQKKKQEHAKLQKKEDNKKELRKAKVFSKIFAREISKEIPRPKHTFIKEALIKIENTISSIPLSISLLKETITSNKEEIKNTEFAVKVNNKIELKNKDFDVSVKEPISIDDETIDKLKELPSIDDIGVSLDEAGRIRVAVDRVGGSGAGSFDKEGLSTEEKQDDIIAELQSKVCFNTNDIVEDGTDTYFGKETKDGEWWFMKIDINSNFSHATILNNNTITNYQQAKASYNTLNYEDYNNAFN